jgi:glutaredoxin
MKRLYLFTAEGCSHCEEMRMWLLSHKISFFDLDVQEHADSFITLMEATEMDYVPAAWIKQGDTNTYIVPERDFKSIPEGAEKIKEALLG